MTLDCRRNGSDGQGSSLYMAANKKAGETKAPTVIIIAKPCGGVKTDGRFSVFYPNSASVFRVFRELQKPVVSGILSPERDDTHVQLHKLCITSAEHRRLQDACSRWIVCSLTKHLLEWWKVGRAKQHGSPKQKKVRLKMMLDIKNHGWPLTVRITKPAVKGHRFFY